MQFITVWPWTLTYNLEVQSQPRLGQGHFLYQKCRSKVQRFKLESSDKHTNICNLSGFDLELRQTHKQTHRRYRTHYLPCFTVDNNMVTGCDTILMYIPGQWSNDIRMIGHTSGQSLSQASSIAVFSKDLNKMHIRVRHEKYKIVSATASF